MYSVRGGMGKKGLSWESWLGEEQEEKQEEEDSLYHSS